MAAAAGWRGEKYSRVSCAAVVALRNSYPHPADEFDPAGINVKDNEKGEVECNSKRMEEISLTSNYSFLRMHLSFCQV